MAAITLDGAKLAAEIRRRVRDEIAAHTAAHGPIKLAVLLVGQDHAARLYAETQQRQCVQIGIAYELREFPADTSQRDLVTAIERLNRDPAITGIMLQMPLPRHIDAAAAQFHIDPYKDVEGVNPANIGMLFYEEPILAPCTAQAVMELIRTSGVTVRGANAAVIGQSRIVGRPISMFLLTQMATVIGCHVATRDVRAHAKQADIVVVAVGKAHLVDASYIKPGAVVIDVGINSIREPGPDGELVRRTVGDVDYAAVREVAGAITPVPGGVGPVTVAMLLRNCVEAARKQLEERI